MRSTSARCCACSNKGLARDHAKTTVYPMSALGLVEMTRKRTTESLARQLCEPCPACSGRGQLKTAETVTYEIFREITRAVRQFNAEKLLVMASPRSSAASSKKSPARWPNWKSSSPKAYASRPKSIIRRNSLMWFCCAVPKSGLDYCA
jgi:Ribonuclease G/E